MRSPSLREGPSARPVEKSTTTCIEYRRDCGRLRILQYLQGGTRVQVFRLSVPQVQCQWLRKAHLPKMLGIREGYVRDLPRRWPASQEEGLVLGYI
jgi:hypothetical protein